MHYKYTNKSFLGGCENVVAQFTYVVRVEIMWTLRPGALLDIEKCCFSSRTKQTRIEEVTYINPL